MDTQTIIIVVIVVVIAYLIYRNLSTANSNLRKGSERPSFDKPNIQGHGGFGRDRDDQHDTSNSDATQPSSHRDNPNIRGKGSFGRDKS